MVNLKSVVIKQKYPGQWFFLVLSVGIFCLLISLNSIVNVKFLMSGIAATLGILFIIHVIYPCKLSLVFPFSIVIVLNIKELWRLIGESLSYLDSGTTNTKPDYETLVLMEANLISLIWASFMLIMVSSLLVHFWILIEKFGEAPVGND